MSWWLRNCQTQVIGICMAFALLLSSFGSIHAQGEIVETLQIEPAKRLAQVIKDNNLQEINANTATDVEIIQRVNFAVEAINQQFDFNFPKLEPTQEEMDAVDDYVPLVEPYNNLIRAAYAFDEKRPETVQNLYIAAFVLAGDIISWKGKIAFKLANKLDYYAAYKATGFITNMFQLRHIAKFCKACLKEVMSQIHWFIRDNVRELFSEWEKVRNAIETGQEAIEYLLPKTGGQRQCVIATAAYGSEIAPEVQFLREFRDTKVLSTASGRNFMDLFNSFYYSWSPTLADIIRPNELMKAGVRDLMLPLIGILSISSLVYNILPSPELGVVVVGFFASSLIGLAYLSVPIYAIINRFGKRSTRIERSIGEISAASVSMGVIFVLLGLTATFSEVLTMGTGIFVVSAVILSAIGGCHMIRRSLSLIGLQRK